MAAAQIQTEASEARVRPPSLPGGPAGPCGQTTTDRVNERVQGPAQVPSKLCLNAEGLFFWEAFLTPPPTLGKLAVTTPSPEPASTL